MEDVLVLGTIGRERVHSFGTTSTVVPGGTAHHAIEAILRAGVTRPLLVSIRGNDLSEAEIVDQLSAPVDTFALHQRTDLPSFYWEAEYKESFEESTTIALENRLLDGFMPDWNALGKRFPSIRYCYLAAFDPNVQISCARYFGNTFVVSETLEYWIERDRQGVLDLARESNGFVVTEREFRALWGFAARPDMPLTHVADVLQQCSLDFLIITFADRGSRVFQSEGTFIMPALACKTVDSTGAGNAFSGGIVGYLAQHGVYERARLPDAVSFGTGLASLQVRDFGNRALRMASHSEIEDLRQEARNGIQWLNLGG
ncbi:MAG: hypothetical protein JJ926_18210 [Roseitalea sp.]|nr:hypothetical protein [Roseitalea sp.]MBO6689929.1 hypothetical protein [Henriciella sp.]MBO6953793.1 hypothetical protein [Rhizobiaceae bacterium]MBO6613931.1 hypothetical protein [Roseitalea sp.]MBO6673380.1 hypothetical protein [Roseitalea sp.]